VAGPQAARTQQPDFHKEKKIGDMGNSGYSKTTKDGGVEEDRRMDLSLLKRTGAHQSTKGQGRKQTGLMKTLTAYLIQKTLAARGELDGDGTLNDSTLNRS